MGKKIIYIMRGKLHLYPPCVSQLCMLSEYIDEVVLINTECESDVALQLENRGVKVKLIGDKRLTNGKIGKISSYLYFRKQVLKILQHENKDNTVLWFGSADSAIALTGKLDGWKYIVNSLELYDKISFYRKGLTLIVREAIGLVVCEYNRACIMKSWWSLDKLPYIMPNKPYNHPQSRNIDIYQDQYYDVITKIKGSKAIIYQGLIMWSISHLENIAKALAEIDDNYSLVLLGNSDERMFKKLKGIYSKTINIEYIPSPNHLIITSYAYMGVATYDETSLNNLYCAPNKIYEYAGFGIPMLCSDIPGLRYTVGTSRAGECINLSNIADVKNSIEKIDKKYEEYSHNALEFFNKTDNTVVMKNILLDIHLVCDKYDNY